MKVRSLLSVTVVALLSTMAQSAFAGFEQIGGTGSAYSVTSANTWFWAISRESDGGGNYKIKRWTGSQWLADGAASGTSITSSVGQVDSYVWAVATDGVYIRTNGTWQRLTNSMCAGGTLSVRQLVGHNNIAVGFDPVFGVQIVWVIGSDRTKIYSIRYGASCWDVAPTLPSPANDIAIDVTTGSAKFPFVEVDNGNGFYRWSGSAWTSLAGSATSVAVWNGVQNVAGTGSPQHIHYYNTSSNDWVWNSSYTAGTTTISQIGTVAGYDQWYDVIGVLVGTSGQVWASGIATPG